MKIRFNIEPKLLRHADSSVSHVNKTA
jgi:hypothetical protein